MRIPVGFQLGMVLLILCILPACAGGKAGLKMHAVPYNGFDQTLNFQFQAQVFKTDEGECKRMVVRVKPLNKVYWKTPPPDRLQLYDDDCLSPVRFERLQFLSRESGGLQHLAGPEINFFWSEHFRLQDELVGWLWSSEIL
ncbi:MAG: hypothetical protein AB8G77_05100 [Rhodothermales bacterium]